MTALTVEDFDELSRPRRNRPARPTERRTAIAESSGDRRHRSRERVA